MATREELEKLKCGDKILIGEYERSFIGLKPFGYSHPAVYLDTNNLPTAAELSHVELIKPKKKLYAYLDRTGLLCEFIKEIDVTGYKRAPEWDREEK